MTNRDLNREPRWDAAGELPTGRGHVAEPGPFRKSAKYFYRKWQFWGAQKPGRKSDEGWPLSRPGTKDDYLVG